MRLLCGIPKGIPVLPQLNLCAALCCPHSPASRAYHTHMPGPFLCHANCSPLLPQRQVHMPASHRRVISAGAHAAFCIQDLKMVLAAKACLCPGLPTLLGNLCRSFSERDHPRSKDAPCWMKEYAKGMENQIYCVPIPRSFVGKEFLRVATHVHGSLSAVLLGIVSDAETSRVVLNPGPDWRFRGKEQVVVISNKKSTASKISHMAWSLDDQRLVFPFTTFGCPLRTLFSTTGLAVGGLPRRLMVRLQRLGSDVR